MIGLWLSIPNYYGVKDKGVDVMGFKGNQREIAVQCKAWNPLANSSRIAVKDVQSFKSRVLSDDYRFGLFITTYYFTDPVLQEENEH